MNYKNALIEKGYFDERPVLRVRAKSVDIGARAIVIEWQEGSRKCRFEGVRTGQGHFLLDGDDGASATLHRFQYSTILEGFWKRYAKSGFWRIHLPDETLSPAIALPKLKNAMATKPRKPARRVRVAA